MSRTRDDLGSASQTKQDFEAQMKVARRVMKDERVVLRALALSDKHPDVDVATLIEMAESQLKSAT